MGRTCSKEQEKVRLGILRSGSKVEARLVLNNDRSLNPNPGRFLFHLGNVSKKGPKAARRMGNWVTDCCNRG